MKTGIVPVAAHCTEELALLSYISYISYISFFPLLVLFMVTTLLFKILFMEH